MQRFVSHWRTRLQPVSSSHHNGLEHRERVTQWCLRAAVCQCVSHARGHPCHAKPECVEARRVRGGHVRQVVEDVVGGVGEEGW